MELALDAAHNVEVGDQYFERKNYMGALFRYKDAVEEKTADPAIHVRLGRTFEKINQVPQAIEQYTAAEKLAGPEKWSDEARAALARLQGTPGASSAVERKPDEGAKKEETLQGRIFDLGPGIIPPSPTSTPDPDYPESARSGKHPVQGTCVLAVIVGEDGSTRDVHVVRSDDKRLDQIAIDTVKRWKFTPALKDGKHVAVRTQVMMTVRMY